MDTLDPVVVDQLRSLARAGNPQLLQRLQESFARDTPQRVHALRAAVAAGDADAVAFNVHTLTGSAANLGAQELVATCGLIAGSPVGGDPLDLALLLDDLERQAAEAQDALARLAEAG